MAAAQPIRSKRQIRALSEYYLRKNRIRNHVLIIMGLYTALRVSDLLRLTWDDVYDFDSRRVRTTFEITEKKTRKLKIVALNKEAARALALYVKDAKRGAFLFINVSTGKAISRIQAYRLIRAAGEALRFEIRISCHSLRKTFGYHAWKNGASPAVIMEIYNHSSMNVTRRYLGVTQDDKNAVYLGIDFTL